MEQKPKPEEILVIGGGQDEALFWHLKIWLIAEHAGDLQTRIDTLWDHYKEVVVITREPRSKLPLPTVTWSGEAE